MPTIDDDKNLLTPYNRDSELLPINEERLAIMAKSIENVSLITERKIIFNTSPLQRGIKMVQKLNEYIQCNGEIKLDDRWRNINQGEVAGLSQAEFQKEPLWRIWHERPQQAFFPNGENIHNVYERISGALSSISRQGHINVIVSHTTPLQVILTSLLNIDISNIWTFYFEYYSLTVVINNTLLCANTKSIDLDGIRKLIIK